MEGAGAVYLLRIVHILSGAFWVGAGLFVAFFLMPSLRALGSGAGPVMEQLAGVRKLPLYMMGATVLTILSGIGLYWRDSGGFSGPWMRSGQGTVFGLGGALALIAGGIGMALTSPSAKRMSAMAVRLKSAGRPPTPEEMAEMQSLQDRMAKSSRLAIVLGVLATAAMAVARYIP